MEDLRQIIFREQSGLGIKLDDVWWKYVLAFGEKCVDKDPSEITDCRDDIYATLPPSSTRSIESEITNSFPGGNGKGENGYLKSEVNDREEMSVDHYPAFYVNKARYTVIVIFFWFLNIYCRQASETNMRLENLFAHISPKTNFQLSALNLSLLPQQ